MPAVPDRRKKSYIQEVKRLSKDEIARIAVFPETLTGELEGKPLPAAKQ